MTFKFTTSASLLSLLLESTSNKGHVFIMPDSNGITFTNSKEEALISVYNCISADQFNTYTYNRDEEDAYCFMVGDVAALISGINGDVSLDFDLVDSKKPFMKIKSLDGKISGSVALKDEVFMEDELGLKDAKLRAREHMNIALGEDSFTVPVIMVKMGMGKFFKFEKFFSPLIIFSDDVTMTVHNKANKLSEFVRTLTSTYTFSEGFSASKLLTEGAEDVFTEDVNLAVTSDSLEMAIKKHKGKVQHMILMKLNSKRLPYNAVFISERSIEGSTFTTASILDLRS